MNGDEREHRWITNAELKEEIDKLPTRWEVRALILGAIVVSNVVPPINLARNEGAAYVWAFIGWLF